jgi:hypothetical protein
MGFEVRLETSAQVAASWVPGMFSEEMLVLSGSLAIQLHVGTLAEHPVSWPIKNGHPSVAIRLTVAHRGRTEDRRSTLQALRKSLSSKDSLCMDGLSIGIDDK